MTQLCGYLSALVFHVEQFEVCKGCIPRSKWPEDMERMQLPELLDTFVPVEILGIQKVGQLVFCLHLVSL
jgi:hypothetical protein